jgi:hypothetical protein
MRPAIVLLLLSGEMLAACGSTMHPAPKAHSAGVPGPGTTGSPITKPRALAFAGAVNLTAADVPGFTVSAEHQHDTTQERRLERELLHCVGGAGSRTELAEESSKNFELERGILQLSVSSQVSVAQTPATAAGELSAIRSAHVQACLSYYVGQLLKSQHYPGGVTVGPVSIVSGTPPAHGTTGGFGWRVTARLTIPGVAVPVPFYLDILGFVYGPSTVTLFSTGALRPFPAAAQQHLFSLLLSRAKGQRL